MTCHRTLLLYWVGVNHFRPDIAHTRCLRDPGEVGDRDADQSSVDGVHIVEFQGINDQARTIGQRSSSVDTM